MKKPVISITFSHIKKKLNGNVQLQGNADTFYIRVYTLYCLTRIEKL